MPSFGPFRELFYHLCYGQPWKEVRTRRSKTKGMHTSIYPQERESVPEVSSQPLVTLCLFSLHNPMGKIILHLKRDEWHGSSIWPLVNFERVQGKERCLIKKGRIH